MTLRRDHVTRIPGIGEVANTEILMTGLNGIMAATVGLLVDGVGWAIIGGLVMLMVPLVPAGLKYVDSRALRTRQAGCCGSGQASLRTRFSKPAVRH